eukprot:3791875-Rhodomonas_salina.1
MPEGPGIILSLAVSLSGLKSGRGFKFKFKFYLSTCTVIVTVTETELHRAAASDCSKVIMPVIPGWQLRLRIG